MHGVNVVLPDTSFLRENQKRIRGMIVTHGHEDHIGGIAHHLKHFNIPVIYGPRLALSMLTGKMDEAGVTDRTTLQTVGPRDVVKVGSASRWSSSATPTRWPTAFRWPSAPRWAR